MSVSADGPHAEIATRLAARLVLLVAVAGFCTWVLLPWPSVLSVPLVLLVDLVVLWLAVHYLFAALNDLLEAKLAALDRPVRSDGDRT